MADTATSLKLTSEGAMRVLHAAAKKAAEMGVPQCITVVDPGGHLLAFMHGRRLRAVDRHLDEEGDDRRIL
jgi:uncharacterized protein GlcG (DUF336 family)